MSRHWKRSIDVVSLIFEEIKEANTIFAEFMAVFERTAAKMGNRELLKVLDAKSEEYKLLLGDIMRDRARARERASRDGNKYRPSSARVSAGSPPVGQSRQAPPAPPGRGVQSHLLASLRRSRRF